MRSGRFERGVKERHVEVEKCVKKGNEVDDLEVEKRNLEEEKKEMGGKNQIKREQGEEEQ